MLAVQLIILTIFGAVCAAIASSKGRSTVGWFFAGFFGGLIGLIIILCLSNLKDEQRYREHAAAERRRLNEQLRQERMKNESFRRYAGSRIDAHDRALGVDTRANPELLAAGPGGVPPPTLAEGGAAMPPVPPPGAPAATWFYEVAGTPRGPVPRSRLVDLLRSGEVSPESLVWSEGMADWLPASQVAGLEGP